MAPNTAGSVRRFLPAWLLTMVTCWAAPLQAQTQGPVLADDLARVPEITYHEPVNVPDTEKNLGAEEKASLAALRAEQLKKIKDRVGRSNESDLFLEKMLQNRFDLAGLPFTLGDACRMPPAEAKRLGATSRIVRTNLAPRAFENDAKDRPKINNHRDMFWHFALKERRGQSGEDDRCWVACLTQVLARESPKFRVSLVQNLPKFDTSDAGKKEVIRALVRLAIFSVEDEVRQAAAAALEKRDTLPADDLLLQGLRYPWPAVAQHTADLIVRLKRSDLADELTKMLDEPDPRAPVRSEVKGTKTAMVREVVRINHLRSCLLCHPPGTSSNPVVGPIPDPTQPLPVEVAYYQQSQSDNLVRADVTYLRQDFSVMQPVAGADPWPEMQRFDFLVRTRVLTLAEERAFEEHFAGNMDASPYRQLARSGLRRLGSGT